MPHTAFLLETQHPGVSTETWVKPAPPFQAFLGSMCQALPCRDSGPTEVLVEYQGGEWGHPGCVLSC